MSRPWIFICPSTRGIGYHLTRLLLRRTTLPVLATARSGSPSDTKSELLKDLPGGDDLGARLKVVKVDVTDESTIEEAAHKANDLFPRASHHLHLAFAIPGILHPEKNPRQVDAERALQTYRVNTLGPLLLLKHFSDFLPRSTTDISLSETKQQQTEIDSQQQEQLLDLPNHAVWANMSARVGSITDNRAGGWYSYRSSKTAVYSITRSFDNFLRARSGDKAISLAYHPGTVKTDLSKEFWGSVEEGKLLSPEHAADKMVDVLLRRVGVEQRGRFFDWKGEEVPP
jgi:NAD(P)-dependent dehydrogenase (short-subunit alcohol dehydrogenase family)